MKTYGLVKGEKSQVFISVLIVLAIVLALGVALLFHSRSFRDVASLQVDTDQAYSLAKSGIGKGEALINDPCGGASLEEEVHKTYNIGEGTIEIDIYPRTGVLKSTGIMGRSVRVLQKSFKPIELIAGGAGITWANVYNLPYFEGLIVPLQQTSDGGYILGSLDFKVIKTDPSGTVQWAKEYDGPGQNMLYALEQTSDGGYILAGWGTYWEYWDEEELAWLTQRDCLAIKIDAEGDVEWARTFSDRWGERDDRFSSAHVTAGGYLFGGFLDYYSLLIKTDPSGDLDWARAYALPGLASIRTIYETSDGYVLGGNNPGTPDPMRLMEVSKPSGDSIQWARRYNGVDTRGVSTLFQPTPDGGYILGGRNNDFLPQDSFVIKTDSQGVEQWVKIYSQFSYGYPRSILLTSDGYILLEEESLFKIDSSGAIGDWARTYAIGTYTVNISSIQQTSDGYILAGLTSSAGNPYNFLLIRTNESGNVVCCDIVDNRNVDITDVGTYSSEGLSGSVRRYPSDFDLLINEYDGNPSNPANDFIIETTDIEGSITTTPICPQ